MSENEQAIYTVGALVVGVPTFLGSWIFAAANYGLFLGIGLGWLPALFIGVMVGLLWPVLVLGAVAITLIVLGAS